jgi:hypothetical protein
VKAKAVIDLKPADVTQWLLANKDSWKHISQVTAGGIVRSCLNWGIEQGYTHANPLSRMKTGSYYRKTMARQVANAASKAACFSTKRSAVWIMRTVKSVTESLGGHSRIPLQSALGRRGEPGKRSSQPGNSPTRDEKHLGNPGFQ